MEPRPRQVDSSPQTEIAPAHNGSGVGQGPENVLKGARRDEVTGIRERPVVKNAEIIKNPLGGHGSVGEECACCVLQTAGCAFGP